MSSRLTICVAPCRSAVAMQSVPVSPPPMTTTFLPAAETYDPSARSLSSSDLVFYSDRRRQAPPPLAMLKH